jgi:hypothetical protein
MPNDKKPAPPAAGTAAWNVELIAILEAILGLLPVSSESSETTRAELTARVATLKDGFPKESKES